MTLGLLQCGQQAGLAPGWPRREHQQHRTLEPAVQQMADKVNRRGIGPMEVVKSQHKRALLGEPAE